jgi:hypothetical protein
LIPGGTAADVVVGATRRPSPGVAETDDIVGRRGVVDDRIPREGDDVSSSSTLSTRETT